MFNSGKKYRGESLIISAILESAQAGVSRTKIMYEAYLNYYQCNGYLLELERDGLIEAIDEERKIWKTTQRGFTWLQLEREQKQLILPSISV